MLTNCCIDAITDGANRLSMVRTVATTILFTKGTTATGTDY